MKCFFEDALTASRELNITLTGRAGGMEEKIPMCGVPYHSVDNYIAKLIKKVTASQFVSRWKTLKRLKG